MISPSINSINLKVNRKNIEFLFNIKKNLNIPSLYQYVHKSAKEDINSTILISFYIRDCRGGLGYKYIGRKIFTWLFLNYPDKFMKIFHLIPNFGRWDDLIELWPGVLKLNDIEYVRNNFYSNIKDEDYLDYLRKLQKKFVEIVTKQLKKDYDNMINNKPISTCCKWSPVDKNNIVFVICKDMCISRNCYYKKYVLPLRQYLKVKPCNFILHNTKLQKYKNNVYQYTLKLNNNSNTTIVDNDNDKLLSDILHSDKLEMVRKCLY